MPVVSKNSVAARLKEARSESGMSTRAVAELLPRRLSVSHATIANYEKGASGPSLPTLSALAEIYARPVNWFLEKQSSLSSFRYRNLKSRVRVTDKRRYEAGSNKWINAYFGLEKVLREPLRREYRVCQDISDIAPKKVAQMIRREHLGIADSQAIANTIEVLEKFGIRTIELATDLAIDGLAAKRGNDCVIVLNPKTSHDRLRLNAVHELAHVLYDDCKESMGWDEKFVEFRAYEFGSNLLLPDSELTSAFRHKSFLRLIEYKERFGISLAAMIYRAEKARLIPRKTARWLWVEFSKRGWRKKEPGSVWRDRAVRFECLLESAIARKELSWKQAESATGVREQELRVRIESLIDESDDASGDKTADQEPDVLEFDRTA